MSSDSNVKASDTGQSCRAVRRSREWCCYLNDAELAERLNIGTEKLSMLRVQPGFPPRDAITNKRFWPAVEAWLLRRHRIDTNGEVDEGGGPEVENWS